MKRIKILALVLFISLSNTIFAQENLIDSIIQQNYYTFKTKPSTDSFSGQGWEILLKRIHEAKSILIGETHFTNEVPYFTNAIVDAVNFDNYFHEIDPYSNQIIAAKIKTSSSNNLDQFVKEYHTNFSFLEIEKDFALFEKIVRSDIQTFGIEQISLFSDRLIISTLNKKSINQQAKEIYAQMIQNSKNLAIKEEKEFYLFSDDCLHKIDSLLQLRLSKEERKQIEDLKLSREIYLNRNHPLRIQLMKKQVLAAMPNWINKKNLFKFGAYHTPKGESLLEIFDIGNLVHTIEDAHFRSSLHIMLIGKSEQENMDDLKLYDSFLKVVNSDDWHCFDLKPLQMVISENKLKIENPMLLRIIKGNDYLIYVPKFTRSKSMYEEQFLSTSGWKGENRLTGKLKK